MLDYDVCAEAPGGLVLRQTGDRDEPEFQVERWTDGVLMHLYVTTVNGSLASNMFQAIALSDLKDEGML